jgi:beta-ureidopropionase
VVPIHTRDEKGIYNAAIFFDRSGAVLGEYRKMRPTENELSKGISPGPEDPPVLRTDFGVVGAQICFDIEFAEGPRRLMEKRAEMIFFPAAFAGGQMVNAMAWQTRAHVVSSTRKDTAKICDVSGEEIATTGRWNPNWAIAPVNLEKVFLHSWPYSKRFNEILAKYGRKVRITNFDEEEWSVLESRDPEVRVADIMREFELKTRDEHLASAERRHRSFWAGA